VADKTIAFKSHSIHKSQYS